ncbi:chromaffin granule amine transporter-like [Aethina tumida]|uniref:chromaffin granule amine transporter-like n=1 Tax=Aethina tumida TaxID=116153 RepID=UPI002148CBAB|nr:chromaffin granule amine transporter-like [Aethina tumida]
MEGILNVLRDSNILVFVIVYLSFLLDNVLLTVVVPIIPDYLFSNVLNVTVADENSHFGPASLSPLQRKYETLEDDNGPLGALLASKAFVQLAFTPIVGYLIEVLGCNIPLLLGSCNMLLAAILFAYGNSYGILVLARALHGSSSAAIAVSGMCILAKNVPKDLRFKFMPLAFGGIALGVLIGYPLGGAAYELMGKAAPFLMIAFFISISIVLQITLLQENDMDELPDVQTSYYDWINLLRDKSTLIITGAICICTSSMAILEPCVPIWLLGHLNPPPSKWQLGAVFIPDSIGYFIGSHFAALLPVAPWRTTISAMVLTGLSCCALPLANNLFQLAIPHFGLGLGVGIVDAVLVPLLANLVDSRGSSQYGPVYALQQASVSLAYSFGPLLGGEAVRVFGFPWLIRIVGFMNLLFCPLLLELEKNKENRSQLLGEDVVSSYSSFENTNTSDEWK